MNSPSPTSVVPMSTKRLILKEMATPLSQEQITSLSSIKAPVSGMYDRIPTLVPRVITSNQEGNVVGDYLHSLSNLPRHIHLPSKAETADEIRTFWQELNVDEKTSHEKFVCIAGTILKYLESQPLIKNVFQSFVKRNKNPDVSGFIEYLLSGSAEPFAISKISNKAYENYVVDDSFIIARMVKMKKDLVECFITCFDTYCFHRSIYTGFEVLP